MPSRIKGTDTSAVETGKSRVIGGVRRSASVTGNSSAAPTTSADSVSITDTARRLAALQEHIASLPEVDAQRVTELRQAIEQGKYSANPGAIADKLLQLENDLSQSRQQRKQG